MSNRPLGSAFYRYGDFLNQIAEVFEERSWTAADLRRQGIALPQGKSLTFFSSSGAIERVSKDPKHASVWKLTAKCMQKIREAV